MLSRLETRTKESSYLANRFLHFKMNESELLHFDPNILFEEEQDNKDPKDGELFLINVNPEETLVEA